VEVASICEPQRSLFQFIEKALADGGYNHDRD
jgi:hypothetical protein